MVSLPLTGFPGQDTDPVWVYVTGWALYSSTWIIIISAALHQVMSQVDYNLSQVCHEFIKFSQVTAGSTQSMSPLERSSFSSENNVVESNHSCSHAYLKPLVACYCAVRGKWKPTSLSYMKA
jgi:hypothetical protein